MPIKLTQPQLKPTTELAASHTASVAGLLQRACACGQHTGSGGECAECKKKRLQRKAVTQAEPKTAPPIVHEVLRSLGQPLDAAIRAYMEPRFGHDFSRVRVHTGPEAAESARAVNALAYTVGQDVVFGADLYAPGTNEGRALLAHELTHTIQQGISTGASGRSIDIGLPSSASEQEADRSAAQIDGGQQLRMGLAEPVQIARACTAAATCSPAGVPGSATEFGTTEEGRELGPRARRRRMTPARAISTGHAGRARQLENFLNAQQPGRLANIQGIFIDHDLSPFTGAMTQDCAGWAAEALPAIAPTPPGMVGAVKPCTFVHGNLNQEALAFNRTAATTIGGDPREEWRVNTLQILIHETEHPRFETATSGLPRPAGVTSATCTRPNVEPELSEIAAVMSEFPTIFTAASAEADPTGPFHASLNSWFNQSIHTGGENISSALLQMGCSCDCPEVDAFVTDTVGEVTTAGAWSLAMRTDFNTKLRSELPPPGRPSWPL